MPLLEENRAQETTKHRELVAKYCEGDGLDLGSFADPINDRAIRIDRNPKYCHLTGDVSDLSRFADATFDYVHSSHVLEDFADWTPVLAEWQRVLKPGGYLIVAVPDHERFRAVVTAGQPDNLDHRHESYLGELQTFLPDWPVELSQFVSEGDYSIVNVLRKPENATIKMPTPRAHRPTKVLTFGHSGDLGDVIYALPTMKALCEKENAMAHIVLYAGPGVREAFDIKRAYNMGDLLMELPWVRKWNWCDSTLSVGRLNYDFQDWRDYYGKYCDNGRDNLARTPAEFFRVDPDVINHPWITGIKPTYVSHPTEQGGPPVRRTIVVARSNRYRDMGFPWAEISARYGNQCVTIGTTPEISELYHQFGFTFTATTDTLLDVARLISGAELVITNQTATYAIAEAMKKPVLLERCPAVPNVDFDRPDVWSGDRVREFLDRDLDLSAAAHPPIKGVKRTA